MKNTTIVGMLSLTLSGCDHFPGPNLKNDFGNEITVSIEYGDGTKASPILPPCQVIGIGPNEVERFGMVAKNVAIDRIVVESEVEDKSGFSRRNDSEPESK